MMDFKDKLYSYLSVGIIIACCCTLVIGWIPIFDRTWLWALLLVFISFLFYKEGLMKNYMFPLLFYGFILYLNVYVGDPRFDWISSTMELSYYFIVSYVFYIFSQESFYETLFYFLLLYFVVIVITFIGTTIIYVQEPEILRMIQGGVNEGDLTLFNIYAKLGVESYEMGHALPSLIPIIVYVIKKTHNLLTRFFFGALLFMILSLVYMSTATTSLLLSVILVFLSFVLNNNRTRNVFVILFCSCVTLSFFFNRELLGGLLDNFTFESSDTYAGKVEDFQDYAIYGTPGRQTSGRLDLYKRSLDVFCTYPIIGSDDSGNIGGHSVFLDRMAMLGLLGFIPLLIYLFVYMRYVLQSLFSNTRIYCLLGFIFYFIMGFLKNIFNFEYIIITLLIMPLLCLYVDRVLPISDECEYF